MKTNKKQVILNENAIEKLNEFSSDITVLKQGFNLLLYCLANETYMDSPVEQVSFCYILYNYMQTLKSNFIDFLQEENIIL